MSLSDQIKLDALKAYADTSAMVFIVKDADQVRRSNVTLAADSSLRFIMAADASYCFRCVMFFDSDPAADFKWRTSGPASPTKVRIQRQNIGCGDTAPSDIAVDTAYSSSDISVACSSATGGWIELEGVITNGSTEGYFEVHWAQETSDASDTTVLKGSFIQYKAIGV
jgi:hypothetical protein